MYRTILYKELMIKMRSKKHYKKERRSRKIIYETLISLAILFAILLGTVSGYYGSKVFSFLDDISEDSVPDDPETLENTQQLKKLEPFSVLILGTDVVEDGVARSDTMIVATVNPTTEDMKLVSVPRDTFVTLPGGRESKINAAFSAGGPLLAKEIVSDYLDIPIDFYASMDFEGLVELVDAVNGVDVYSDLEFTEGSEFIEQGDQRLNGEEALAYARMRKDDPRGDFGRQDRQKEVIVSILDQLNSALSITKLTSILDAIGPHLKTNASKDQMFEIAFNYSSALNNIDQLTLEGEGTSRYFPSYDLNLYIWEADEEELIKTTNELKRHLNMNTF